MDTRTMSIPTIIPTPPPSLPHIFAPPLSTHTPHSHHTFVLAAGRRRAFTAQFLSVRVPDLLTANSRGLRSDRGLVGIYWIVGVQSHGRHHRPHGSDGLGVYKRFVPLAMAARRVRQPGGRFWSPGIQNVQFAVLLC